LAEAGGPVEAARLSDILGNHTLLFSGAVNGRIAEAQVLAAYINQTRRFNWATGFSQDPLYFYAPTTEQQVGTSDTFLLTVGLRRFVLRAASVGAFDPLSRLHRPE